MKKYFSVVLASVLVFLFVQSLTGSISEYLIAEDGYQYLILPISKSKIIVFDEYIRYLNYIDLDLLETSEKKITEEVSQYPNKPSFLLNINEGYLCLCVEAIVNIDPPQNGEVGCGIDHEHKFFVERISKRHVKDDNSK